MADGFHVAGQAPLDGAFRVGLGDGMTRGGFLNAQR